MGQPGLFDVLRRNDMKFKYSLFSCLMLVGSSLLVGCPADFSKLEVANQSDLKIKTLLNLTYPDSSLRKAAITRYLDPHEEGFVGGMFDLEAEPGLTLIVFDHSYYQSKWHEGVGTPDEFLDDNKILKRIVLSRSQLDSLDWRLIFP